MSGVRITAHGAVEALSAFTVDTLLFFEDNPTVLVALICLAVVAFRLTKPRVH